jgi:hypothetical protein
MQRFKIEVRTHSGEADHALTDLVREKMWDEGWTAYYDLDDDPDDPATFTASNPTSDVYEALIDLFHFRIALYDTVPECVMRFRNLRYGERPGVRGQVPA